jgi:integrase
MATIVYRKGRPRPWLCQIKRKGHKTFSKAFELRQHAERWGKEQDRSIDLVGLPLTIKEYESIPLSALVSRYLETISRTKASFETDKIVLTSFLKRPLATKSIAYVTPQDAAAYRDERLTELYRGKPISPPTVRREVNTLQHVFEIARTEWGYSNLRNPFRGLRIKGSIRRRTRRLEKGELRKLEIACEACRGPNRWFVRLAIYLAIETGMRLQEIFNLTFNDIDLHKRRIIVRKSKTDHVTGREGRTIVLPFLGWWFLIIHIRPLEERASFNGSDRLFPMTKGAFKQTWSEVIKRAKVKNLTFHDLRREAGSWFDQAGLTKGEHDLMMGHANRDMTSLYIHADLNSIQDKLARIIHDSTSFSSPRRARAPSTSPDLIRIGV